MSSPLDEFLKAHEKEQDALQKALQDIGNEDRARLKEVLEIHAEETQRTLDLLAEGEKGRKTSPESNMRQQDNVS